MMRLKDEAAWLDLTRERAARFGKAPVNALPVLGSTPKPSKLGNEKTDGYDSKREARRAADLELLQRAGTITNLRKQVKFLLIPAYRDAEGKLLERQAIYTADFVYDEHGEQVVEDCKGFRMEAYVLRRKLMLFVHGIKVRET